MPLLPALIEIILSISTIARQQEVKKDILYQKFEWVSGTETITAVQSNIYFTINIIYGSRIYERLSMIDFIKSYLMYMNEFKV